MTGAPRTPPEPAAKELGHRLVEIQDDRHADKPERHGGEDQEVRQRVDLDETVVPSAVGHGQGETGPDEEPEVLEEVGSQAGTLVTLDAQAHDTDTIDRLRGAVLGAAQRVNVDRTAGRDEGLGFAPHPGVLLVIGVGEHGDRAQDGWRYGRHERRAAYPNRRLDPWYAAAPMSATADAPAHVRRGAARSGPIGLLREAVVEVAQRRRLIRYLVQADIRKKGADTLLGNLWWVLDPLLQMAVYVVLVSVVFDRGGPDYPLFIFAAILPWKWFQSTVQDAITAVTGADRLIRQIQFPKLVLPVASACAGVVNFAFGLIPLAALILLLYRDRLSAAVLLIPIIAVVQFAFNLALAVGLAAINVFYRDVGNLSRHALRLWFYLSPGLYAVEDLRTATASVPIIGQILLANPFAILFTAYRDVIYGGQAPDWTGLGGLLVASVVLLALATVMFKRVEPAFAKVL